MSYFTLFVLCFSISFAYDCSNICKDILSDEECQSTCYWHYNGECNIACSEIVFNEEICADFCNENTQTLTSEDFLNFKSILIQYSENKKDSNKNYLEIYNFLTSPDNFNDDFNEKSLETNQDYNKININISQEQNEVISQKKEIESFINSQKISKKTFSISFDELRFLFQALGIFLIVLILNYQIVRHRRRKAYLTFLENSKKEYFKKLGKDFSKEDLEKYEKKIIDLEAFVKRNQNMNRSELKNMLFRSGWDIDIIEVVLNKYY